MLNILKTFKRLENIRFIIVKVANDLDMKWIQEMEPNYIFICNSLILRNGMFFQYNYIKHKFINILTIDDVISTDRQIFPETHWPSISSILYNTETRFAYPLFIKLPNKYSGIYGYLGYIFKDYINSKISKKVGAEGLV